MIYHISRLRRLRRVPARLYDQLHARFRAAYGWQRDGGHAPYLLAEENTCIRLPDSLSYIDGALVPAASAPPTRPCGGCR